MNDIFTLPLTFQQVIDNPGYKELRALAGKDERTTEFNSPAYVSTIRSRSAQHTRNTVDGDLTEADRQLIAEIHRSLPQRKLVRIDALMCPNSEFSMHCRFYVSDQYARLALFFQSSLAPAKNPDAEPDLTVIDLPDWPESGKLAEKPAILADPVRGRTYVIGSDYYGEVKKAFLRMTMYRGKSKGHLGLHAGSKAVWCRSRQTGEIEEKGLLLFGLSGTGKTSLTCHHFELDEKAGEKVRVRQDDVVILCRDGRSIGTEARGFYIKTEGLNEKEQPSLYRAVTDPLAVLENVWIENGGHIDFYNTTLTGNGRAVVPVKSIAYTDGEIHLDSVHHIFFITRQPAVPAVARLSTRQAVEAFILGESIKTSAADPKAKGEPVRCVGTNPFIVGPKGEEGIRFYEILKGYPAACYLLNTGSLGVGEKARKIKIGETVALMREICRDGIEWKRDDLLGYEVPASVAGLSDVKTLLPHAYFTREELGSRLGEIRKERRAWCEKVAPEVLPIIEPEFY